MRSISKTMLRTCAGLAVAAGLVVGGAGVANATTTSPTTAQSSHHPACNPWARERWNLNGKNEVKAVYLGTTYTYSVTFRQSGSCLTGTLTDSYYPTTGPIWGTVNKNSVTFSFAYPSGSVQGTRTYTGTINRRGSGVRNVVRDGHRERHRHLDAGQARGSRVPVVVPVVEPLRGMPGIPAPLDSISIASANVPATRQAAGTLLSGGGSWRTGVPNPGTSRYPCPAPSRWSRCGGRTGSTR